MEALKEEIDEGLGDLAEARVREFDATRIVARGRRVSNNRPLRW
jgi:hypothetical protein